MTTGLTRAVKSKWVWLGASVLALLLVGGVIVLAPVPTYLQSRQWQLETVQTTQGTVLWGPTTPGHFTLRFSAYAVQGHGVCNTFEGQVQVTRLINHLAFHRVFTTMVACLPDTNTQHEAAFLTTLQGVSRYAVRADKLYLYSEATSQVLVFK